MAVDVRTVCSNYDNMDKPISTVYTRQGCHLCEEASEVLARHGFHVELVDIDANADLCERYNSAVPVVVIGGKERFRYRVEPRLLQRLLAGGELNLPQ